MVMKYKNKLELERFIKRLTLYFIFLVVMVLFVDLLERASKKHVPSFRSKLTVSGKNGGRNRYVRPV